MTDVQERRDPGTERVAVSTLVEICGNVPGTPVFEAESVDVSARGMHLRTAYLPDAGAPLVCRFENEGSEIVVEGVVAWRREGGRGGEFGVKFTALDSRCVDTLRGLCSRDAGGGASPEREDEPLGEPGSRVRLHIEGLGSPMKARVKTGGSSSVQVGSNLEFLKVGRRLEIEDLEQGARRAAHIDGVSVLVDPSTRIPQLVVALRYEGSEDTTPSPSTADVAGSSGGAARGLRIPAEAVTTDAHAPAAKAPAAASEATSDEDEPELRGRVATLAASAEVRAKAAGEKLAHASSSAARGAASLFRNAADKVRELAQKREKVAPRRTTSVLPQSASEKPRLRPQSAAGTPAEESKPGKRRLTRRTAAIAGAAGVVAATALALALGTESSPPPGATSAASASAASVAVAAAPEGVAPGLPAAAGSVSANVPLFGLTPLTTTEPAPLGPPPNEGVEAEEFAEAKAAAKPAVADESWAEEEAASTKTAKPAAEEPASKKPEDVSPWGRGRMHEPTIHRLRLDGAGAALQGAVEPTGFTVVVPSRKVMEAAGGIAKRDPRIARVRATNTDGGAQVSFRFKDGVPAYRVRLRRDYVEFLISAPAASKASKSSSTEATKSKAARAAR